MIALPQDESDYLGLQNNLWVKISTVSKKSSFLATPNLSFYIFTEDMVHQEEAEYWIALRYGAVIEAKLK